VSETVGTNISQTAIKHVSYASVITKLAQITLTGF